MSYEELTPPKHRTLDSEEALEGTIFDEVTYRIEKYGRAVLIISNFSIFQRDVLLERVFPRILEYIQNKKGPQYKLRDFLVISSPPITKGSVDEKEFPLDLEGCLELIAKNMTKNSGKKIYVENLFTNIHHQ